MTAANSDTNANGHKGNTVEKVSPTQDVLATYAQRSAVRRDKNGQLDLMYAVGGWRGLAEALLPGVLFLGLNIATGQLSVALSAALAVAGVFTVIRLLQRQTIVQALSGLVGVAICAFAAMRSGDARDFYTPGLYINAAYALALLISIVVKWPLMGVVFGYIWGEGTQWRDNPERRRVYSLATGLLVGMFVVRLAVQIPLYMADNVAALGTARLVMGIPLYAMVLWLAWMIARPKRKLENTVNHLR